MFAVEASGIASHAAVLVSHNGLGDIVKVINKRIEDVELPHKVDVIISEWMGFYLLHESMLNSVLDARDKWLKGELSEVGRCHVLKCTRFARQRSFYPQRTGSCFPQKLSSTPAPCQWTGTKKIRSTSGQTCAGSI